MASAPIRTRNGRVVHQFPRGWKTPARCICVAESCADWLILAIVTPSKLNRSYHPIPRDSQSRASASLVAVQVPSLIFYWR
eukprot:scaffold1439_cov282-Pinguiococcus_pyrenoidosus.AAC.7